MVNQSAFICLPIGSKPATLLRNKTAKFPRAKLVNNSTALAQEQSPPTTLERTLGLKDLVLLMIGTVIGSGIFIVPAVVLRQTGSVTVAMLVWLGGGILSLLGALTYGELSAANPRAGGLYIF